MKSPDDVWVKVDSPPKLDLSDEPQKLIAVGVLDLLERGIPPHDVQKLVNHIVQQVWYGWMDHEQRKAGKE